MRPTGRRVVTTSKGSPSCWRVMNRAPRLSIAHSKAPVGNADLSTLGPPGRPSTPRMIDLAVRLVVELAFRTPRMAIQV